MTPTPDSAPDAAMSIGALSVATGIPAETLRTWERRYGFPVATRRPSGHRRYPLSAVARLRRVAAAIAQGHRPADVVGASEGTLELLLAAVASPGLRTPMLSRADLLDLVRSFDTITLRHALEQDWARRGPLDFMEEVVTPLLARIGDAWQDGSLEVRHEHVASACIGDFLRGVRHPLEEHNTGPIGAVCALDGEQHGLGVQMCAVVLAAAGWRPLVLGVDTPTIQVADLAAEMTLGMVAVSCVQWRPEMGDAIARLRQGLPPSVPLLVGGTGRPAELPPSVLSMSSLRELDHWARQAA